VVALLDLVLVAGAIQHSLAMFRSVAGTWLPLGLILLTTWVTGEILSLLPPKDRRERPPSAS
jgi:hypothetical protein